VTGPGIPTRPLPFSQDVADGHRFFKKQAGSPGDRQGNPNSVGGGSCCRVF